MHLFMAIHAALAEQVLRRHAGRQAVCVMRDTRMARLRVTALTQQWCAAGQHARMVRAMWRVTKSAVLADRRVFPEIRATFFCMATVASIVNGLASKLQRSRLASQRTDDK